MSKYPNTFYRVSIKALIKDSTGRVLLCKENSNNWSLPGGGINHGETPLDALRRELFEELNLKDFKLALPSSTHTVFLEEKNAWLMWLVYQVHANNLREISPGPEVTEIDFIDVTQYKNSQKRAEKLVYEAYQTNLAANNN